MPILQYRYGKNARTATDGKNKYGLPVLYTHPKGKTRLDPFRLGCAEPAHVVDQII